MKLKIHFAFRYTLLMIMAILFYISFAFVNSQTPFNMSTASADNQYGIQGQIAPAWNLSTWIDGNGQIIDPIRLADYRGKVVYLYFWQDW